jgi:hypothetical protein
MELIIFVSFSTYLYVLAVKGFILSLKKVQIKEVQIKEGQNNSQITDDGVDWDTLGDRPAYPDTSDHGTADLAADLISLEVQVKAEQNTEKKSQLLSEIKEKYQLLLQLNVLHFDEAPAYADSFFDEDDVEEQPNNIINFAEKTAKLKPV